MSKDSSKDISCCPPPPKNKDHRISNEKLEIFDFDPLVGSGMPLWLQHGNTIREIIKQYINSLQTKHGITMVTTPSLGRKKLYQISGHWDHYQENMFPPIRLDETDEYILRPMTCPHHILLYKKINRHEKHLPISFGENAWLYRYESSGGLIGLERTRCMELIDTHIFCSPTTLKESLQKAIKIIEEVKDSFDIEYSQIILAVRDETKDKFYDDDSLWQNTEKILENFLKDNNIQFEIGRGDAAFYGPKIDFQIKTTLGKTITISTIQLDFLLPQKFELTYMKGESGEKDTPIMIHLGIIGTLERFTSYLLERDGGWLPFWISPVQIAIIPINPKKHIESAKKLFNFFQHLNIRVCMEDGEETLSRRMAKIIERRVYGHVVIGDKEIELVNQITQTIENVDGNARDNWKKVISIVKHSKGDRNNISGKTHPKDHPDILKWASINI